MRKFLFIPVFMLAFSAAGAQVILKGEKFFGGSIAASFSNTNNSPQTENRYSNLGLLPQLSFAVQNDRVLGVRGNLGYTRHETTQPIGVIVHSSISTGLTVFLKKYKPFENRFGFSWEHGLNGYFSFSKNTNPNYLPSDSRNFGLGYHFNPGVFYRLSDRFLGEANIGGLFATYGEGTGDSNVFSVGASFLQYFNLGINYRFGRKTEQAGD